MKSALANSKTSNPAKDKIFTVIADCQDRSGLKLRDGDQYRVLSCDADAIHIAVLNDPSNPYFVSRDFLRTISDFPPEDEANRE